MVNPPGVGVPGMRPDQANNALEFLQVAGIAGAFGGLTANSGYVYLGEEFARPGVQRGGVPYAQPYASTGIDPQTLVTKDAAYTAFWRLQPQQRQEWDDLVTILDGGKRPDESRSNSVWRTVVGYAGETYAADPNRPMSVMEIMKQQAANALDDPRRGGGGGGYAGPVTTVSTTRQIDLTNPTEARAFLDNALGQYLGRRPTEDEYVNFRRALNIQERGAPEIVESTTTVTPRGRAMQTQESDVQRRGGFVPQQFAEEYALSQEGAGETGASILLNDILNVMRGGR